MSTASASSTDRTSTDLIEKTMVLRAPRSKVWRALTDPAQFGEWFGARLTDSFTPGARVRGPVTSRGYEHLVMDITIDRVEPERLFSWRWQPGGDPDIDPAEPMTLVVFELEEVPEGTRLTVRESGFDRIPPARRAKAYRENDAGWAGQFKNLQKYLASAA
ncbi:MAG TPA: SRPBCC family protein [Gemmatimonadales bacterium]|nr:SRPBCC family protein [Gemmatimonadales bacterium]